MASTDNTAALRQKKRIALLTISDIIPLLVFAFYALAARLCGPLSSVNCRIAQKPETFSLLLFE